MKARRLSESGMQVFGAWINSIKQGGMTLLPDEMLSDSQYSEPLEKDVEIEFKKFTNRYEAAEYLYTQFNNVEGLNIEQDRGLWAWLSLFFFDVVCPKDQYGVRKLGAIVRYIPEPGDWRRYYRHLLAGPYRIYRFHRESPKSALALLCQPVDSPGDVVEQLAARQELVTNRGIMELATFLYVDPKTQCTKRGAGGKSGGSARRLTDVIDQLDLTWDLYDANRDELLAVMPHEFDKFKS